MVNIIPQNNLLIFFKKKEKKLRNPSFLYPKYKLIWLKTNLSLY